MEDGLQIILYIIFAIIFIVAKVMKGQDKKQKAPPSRPVVNKPQSRAPVNRPTAPKKTFSSFEELIREFERKALGEEEPEVVKPVKKPVQQHISTTENKYEQNPYSSYKTYEGQSLEEIPSSSIVEKETEAVYERSSHYVIESEQCNRIVQMLRKPEGIQDAVILSEIINRKY